MKIIVLAAQKGGAGKTTLATHIAVQAERVGDGPVALIDTDPQGSLTDWREEREANSPALAHSSPHEFSFQIRKMREAGNELLIVDTPPANKSAIAQVISVSDLVVIPARPSPHDLRAVSSTVDIVREFGNKFVFVLNGAHPTARITMQAMASLSEHGPVSPSIIHQRTDFAISAIDGRTVMEVPGRTRSPGEIAELWKYLKECLYGSQRGRRIKSRIVLSDKSSPIRGAAA